MMKVDILLKNKEHIFIDDVLFWQGHKELCDPANFSELDGFNLTSYDTITVFTPGSSLSFPTSEVLYFKSEIE